MTTHDEDGWEGYFGDDEHPDPDHCEAEALEHRARLALDRHRALLPRLTKAQVAIIVRMMIAAYRAGESESAGWAKMVEGWTMQERSRKAVQARRRQSKRIAIIKAFDAAAAERKEVSVDDLAREHGVSAATVYRALAMAKHRKSPSRSTK